jgi:hypothetical protein
MPDTADAVICAPDNGWKYHPKHVEQFPDKINCVTLHLVRYILEYFYNARTHDCYKQRTPSNKTRLTQAKTLHKRAGYVSVSGNFTYSVAS